MQVDQALFRRLAGLFPSGVTIVTTIDDLGVPRGLTTQAFIGLSTDPPLVLVSVDRSSRTLPTLMGARAFVVNFLKAGSEPLSNRFASKADDKFDGVSWTPSTIARGAPILVNAITGYAECDVVDVIPRGDHVMFVASVGGGQVIGGAPLMYYQRTYSSWPLEEPAPPLS